jgi:hypothetical protein
MPFTLVAFAESLATTVAFQNIAAVPDQHVKAVGDSIFVNEFNRLLGGAAFIGAAGLYARLTSPTLRRIANHYIRPVDIGLVPTTPFKHDIYNDRGIVLDIDEQLQIEFAGSAAGAAQKTALAFLANQPIVPVSGEVITLRATITLAQVAGAWAFSEMTFDDEIPVGNYDVVGLNGVIAGAAAIRLVPVGGFNRPGCIAGQLSADLEVTRIFRNGNLGVWCSFPHNSVPGVEVLGTGAVASATYDIFVDLIKK